ncbi:MAG: carbon-nitrogen hydrolase family protein [Leptospiraceae bacterium]|nr:carbon-nitrogen hydrolase family protein [Leptospiraceae bacterium]MDW8307138.1 carbon-nitrogen hydrolase family protein [Leptospiraceae bacterium]
MHVAALQISSQGDIEENLSRLAVLLQEARKKEVELALLPENFAFFGPEEEKIRRAQQISQRANIFLREMANALGMTVVGGGFPYPARDGKVFNRMLAFSPLGEQLYCYDKTHLFDVEVEGLVYRESAVTEPGISLPTPFSVAELSFLGAICYDLRFPEIFRQPGVDVILLSAAFTQTTGEAHWEVLLRARAIENQCYVVASAQWGQHFGGRKTFGHSMIIDPWGVVMEILTEGDGLVIAELSQERLREVRTKLPALRHRRF